MGPIPVPAAQARWVPIPKPKKGLKFAKNRA